MEYKHDPAFLQILREEKNITNFLDAFFGFLCRCTDFYIESGPGEKLGFPPGTAEKLVACAFQKWKSMYCQLQKEQLSGSVDRSIDHDSGQIDKCQSSLTEIQTDVPEALEEIEIKKEEPRLNTTQKILFEAVQSSDYYNGAIRENYTWSQTITDLDVLVKLPSCIKASKDIKVNISAEQIKVEVRTSVLRQNQITEECLRDSEWSTIFEGQLYFKTRKDESVWSMVPGKHISIHLEKVAERWWEALIIGEPKIELSKLDCTRNLDEMRSEDQMKVQELLFNHQQKLLGKPTSEQIKMENILKRAWNAEGSPFQGTPFDPSVVDFNS